MALPNRNRKRRSDLSFNNVDDIHGQDIRSRMARIEGHLKALRRQLDEGGNCDDLLIQASAIRAAMSAVMAKLVEAHIDSCVKQRAKRGSADEAFEGLKAAFTTALRQL